MVLKTILKFIGEITPVVGDVIDNVKDRQGGVGRFFTPRFVKQMTRLVIVIAALIFFFRGEITVEQLEDLTK